MDHEQGNYRQPGRAGPFEQAVEPGGAFEEALHDAGGPGSGGVAGEKRLAARLNRVEGGRDHQRRPSAEVLPSEVP